MVLGRGRCVIDWVVGLFCGSPISILYLSQGEFVTPSAFTNFDLGILSKPFPGFLEKSAVHRSGYTAASGRFILYLRLGMVVSVYVSDEIRSSSS